MDDREVLGPEVLPTAQPVQRPRQPVVVEGLRQELAPADVEHEGHTGLSQAGPHRVQVHVGGREIPGCVHHGPVERSRAAIEHVVLLGPGELIDGKGGEHEMHVNVQRIEHA